MQTKDPALTKTRIVDNTAHTDEHHIHDHDDHHDDHKGTETFQETVIGTRYPSDDINHNEDSVISHNIHSDDHLHQPDRRDQNGNPFDDNINEHTISGEAAKSEGINDINRYASIDNAQSRVLNPDEKD